MNVVIAPTRPAVSTRPRAQPKPPKPRLITGEELLAMGDIGPCELIDGRIVSITPTGLEHGDIEFALGSALRDFVRQRRLGRVVGGEVGIYTRRQPDRVRAADVIFISHQRLTGKPYKGFLQAAPELVVEILSPDDRWRDVQDKLREYFAVGVERVWLVDPERRKVEVYRSFTEMRQLGEADTLMGEGALDGFALPVASLFEE